jgi:D-alanyl-lipoteichoic acid acyltransferase DltB (MBOAT superfamily)
MRTVLRAGLTYFSLVFAVGFALGTLRVLFLVPALGARNAELLEMPFMLAVIYFAARFVLRHHRLKGAKEKIGTGVLALLLLLVTEFTLVLGLQGLTFAQYMASRDPLAFSAYAVSLVIYGFMPYLLGSRGKSED